MKFNKYQYLALITAIIFSSANTFSQQLRWEKLPSPAFGRVTSMTVGDSLVYVATLQGSIFVSRNEGESWELTTKSLAPDLADIPGVDTLSFYKKYAPFLEDFELIPFITIKNAVLVNSYNGKCGIEGDNGPLILRSLNQGKTWRHILGENKFLDDYDKKYYLANSSPFTGVSAYTNNLYFSLDTLLYIKSHQGYYVSSDYGISWKLLPPLSVTHSTITAQICTNVNTIFNVERSDFNKQLPELKDQSGRYIQLGEHIFTANTNGSLRLVSSPSVLPILSHKNKWFRLNGKNLEISIDKGFTWQVTATLPVQPERLVVNNTSLLVISASQNYRSSDEGKTWVETSQSPDWLGCRVQGIGSSFLLRSTSGTVYRLKGNETIWRLSEQGLESVYYNAVAVTDSVMIVSTIPWASSIERKCNQNIFDGQIMPYSLGYLEAKAKEKGYQKLIFYRSFDKGKTWNVAQSGLELQSCINVNGTLFGSTVQSIFSSKNNGLTWDSLYSKGGLLYYFNNILYLVKNQILGSTIYRSINDGKTWSDVTAKSNEYIRSLRLFNDTLFCRLEGWTEKKAYYFSDKSNTWELDKSNYGVFDSLSNDWFKGLFLNSYSFTFGKYYFISLPYPQFIKTSELFPQSLLLFTHDAKDNITWISKADSGLAPGTFVISMTQHKDTLYAATDNGLYRAVLPKTTSVQASQELVQPQVELSVAPQPSSDKVRIYATLPETGFMELKVFSFQGECISTVTSGRYPAGNHEFVWDVSGYSSGMYMLQLRTTKERHYAKVSVVK